LFGGVGSLGLALQGLKLTSAAPAYLWNAAPFILTLVIMIIPLRAPAPWPGRRRLWLWLNENECSREFSQQSVCV
jgi:hypothetical protein